MPMWLLDSKVVVLKFRKGKVGGWFMNNWPVAPVGAIYYTVKDIANLFD